ncbi:hypothetical protein ES288_D08G020700v1 [Gossypium darwinii]|uniref:Uncharacterized protein n=1 Tax=Gossypium darwinii TaxID=34276 RepID=A0A5D2BK46_GOSDA|nr:hypothetical protein ES288_D08G020700v1 [Gossypium darwinii]
MYKDMEDFLFKMLGEEFRLERDAIQVVDAFVKGDQDQANKILEQAHQADEESNYRSFETRLASCSSTMFAEEPCWFFHSLSLSIIVFSEHRDRRRNVARVARSWHKGRNPTLTITYLHYPASYVTF